MSPLETQQLADLCMRFRVRDLALFGSYARGDFRPGESDRDFAVQFLAMTPAQHKAAYFGLLAGLEALYRCRVDLVERSAVRNPYIRARIEREAQAIYAAA